MSQRKIFSTLGHSHEADSSYQTLQALYEETRRQLVAAQQQIQALDTTIKVMTTGPLEILEACVNRISAYVSDFLLHLKDRNQEALSQAREASIRHRKDKFIAANHNLPVNRDDHVFFNYVPPQDFSSFEKNWIANRLKSVQKDFWQGHDEMARKGAKITELDIQNNFNQALQALINMALKEAFQHSSPSQSKEFNIYLLAYARELQEVLATASGNLTNKPVFGAQVSPVEVDDYWRSKRMWDREQAKVIPLKSRAFGV